MKHLIGLARSADGINTKQGPFRRTPIKSTPAVIRNVSNMIKTVNPQTPREMANKRGVSVGTINIIIKVVLNAKFIKKCKVYKLNEAQIEK